KHALLPGQTATFANYTSYSKGINGIIVDIAGLPSGGASLSADDFIFKGGNDNNPSAWPAAPAPAAVTVRPGPSGASRIDITWPDGAIQKQWLQVTVKADANTGLATADVFYFGNAVGDAGNHSSDAQVTAQAEL